MRNLIKYALLTLAVAFVVYACLFLIMVLVADAGIFSW